MNSPGEEEQFWKCSDFAEADVKHNRIRICINEGYISNHDEEIEMEEQFLLRLPEDQANILSDALENDDLNERLKINFQDNLREADLQLDEARMRGKLMDLPTIVESHKMLDNSTLYKTADVAQILVCSMESESPSTSATAADNLKADKQLQSTSYKFPDGITRPLKNVRKNRFRKIKAEDYCNSKIDREVKRLLRADGAADAVHYELIDVHKEDASGGNEMETIDDLEQYFNDYIDDNFDLASTTSRTDDAAATIATVFNDLFQNDSESCSDAGGVEHYDMEALTNEEKKLRARLSEINNCLSNLTYKPPSLTTAVNHVAAVSGVAAIARGSGRGRGRPRLRKLIGGIPKPQPQRVTVPGRVKRGRPPGRGRGSMQRHGDRETQTNNNSNSTTSIRSNFTATGLPDFFNAPF